MRRVTTVAAFYARESDYDLHARFTPLESELRVTTNVLLTLTDEKQLVHGGFALVNVAAPLFDFDFSAPAGWQVNEVTTEGAGTLPWRSIRPLTAAREFTFACRIPRRRDNRGASIFARSFRPSAGSMIGARSKSSFRCFKWPAQRARGGRCRPGARRHDGPGRQSAAAHASGCQRKEQVWPGRRIDALAFRYAARPYALSLAVSGSNRGSRPARFRSYASSRNCSPLITRSPTTSPRPAPIA